MNVKRKDTFHLCSLRWILFVAVLMRAMSFAAPVQANLFETGSQYYGFSIGEANFSGGTASSSYEEVSSWGLSGSSGSASISTDLDSASTFGGRWGFWSKDKPSQGLVADFTWCSTSDENVEMHILPISLLYMINLSKDKDRKVEDHGIIPYLALGPSIIQGYIEIDTDPPFGGLARGLGIDLRAGISAPVGKGVRLFAEVRQLSGKLLHEDDDEDTFDAIIFFAGGRVRIEEASLSVNTQQIIVGLTIPF
jgi:hypothetical protein